MTQGEFKSPEICCWCRKSVKLVRAHIIPDGFYEPLLGAENKLVILSPNQPKFTQTIQTAIFDSKILCGPCDQFLDSFDEYGLKIFKSRPPEANSYRGGYDLKCTDTLRAQKFILSVLWRASVTKNPFFEKTSLGPKYEDKIRRLVATDKKVTEGDFEMLVCCWDDPLVHCGFMPPWSGRGADGIRVHRLYLPYYFFIVRMDKRPWSGVLSRLRFGAENVPQCYMVPYKSSTEEKVIENVVSATLERLHGSSPPLVR